MKPTELDRLKKQVMLLRSRLEAMQGHTFYIQDEDGCLRRFNPPKASTLFDEDQP